MVALTCNIRSTQLQSARSGVLRSWLSQKQTYSCLNDQELTSLLMPAAQPKELGRPKRSPVRFNPLSMSGAQETGVLKAPMDVVVQFGLRTMESKRMTSSTVLPKLPAGNGSWTHV